MMWKAEIERQLAEKDYLTEIEAKEVSSEWIKEESLVKSACPKAGEIDADEADLKKRFDKTDMNCWVPPLPIAGFEKFRINDLTKEHWSYINSLLDVTMVDETYERDEVLKMIEFHYTTAMIHGWKHAMEVK